MKCKYNPRYRLSEKTWCKEISEVACQPLVSSVSRGVEKLRFSIQEYSRFRFFTVTMTELKMADSGIYHCGFFRNRRNFISILKTIRLVVSKGELPLSMSFLSLPESQGSRLERTQETVSSSRGLLNLWVKSPSGVTYQIFTL